jgi:hypothetical protein
MRHILKTAFVFALIAALMLIAASPASAHDFGVRYDLPL